MMFTSVSSSRTVCLWVYRGDNLWDLSSGSLDGWYTCPSCSHPSLVGCKSFLWDDPGPSSLVWWVCNQPSHKQLVSTFLWLCLSFHALIHWHSSAIKLHVFAQTSSTLLLALAATSSESFSISSILDRNPSKISSSCDLVVIQQHTECDSKQSSLLFHLSRQYAAPLSLGGSCPDPPWAVSSDTAFPLPLSGSISGSMTSSSNSMSLVLGDSCAPAFNLPPVGGLVVVSWSPTPLLLSSQSCLSGSPLTALPCHCVTV